MKEKPSKEPKIEVVSHFTNGSRTLQNVLEEMALKIATGK